MYTSDTILDSLFFLLMANEHTKYGYYEDRDRLFGKTFY